MQTHSPALRSVATRPPRLTLRSALRELALVHELEQAQLLRQASRLRVAAGRAAISRTRLESWRAAASEEIGLCRADLFPVSETLRDCLDLPIRSWGSAAALARAALALEWSDAGRLQVARAELAEGRTRAAIEGLLRLLGEGPTDGARSAAMEALAEALLLEGDARGALACLSAASREPRSSLASSVGALALALGCGNERAAREAVTRLARLDLSTAGTARRFRPALARWKARIGAATRAAPSLLDPRARALTTELARSGPGVPATIARALLEPTRGEFGNE